jgi:predicted RecA/RadA family phage recombinase
MATFLQDGDVLDVTFESAAVAGEVVVLGDNLVGVVKRPVVAGDVAGVAVTGVYRFPKSGEVIAAGDLCYWDTENERVTITTGTGSTYLLGKAIAAAGAEDTTVDVRLSQ